MKSLFEEGTVWEVVERVARLQPESQPVWGTMTVGQMLAHCNAGFDMAVGKVRLPRVAIGRLVGPIAKQQMIVKGKPMPKNVKAPESLVMTDSREFATELEGIRTTVRSFADGGPAGCTDHPHFFFGPLTPAEWSGLMYQHLDHHLRQFGV